jgi:hypothetical protein
MTIFASETMIQPLAGGFLILLALIATTGGIYVSDEPLELKDTRAAGNVNFLMKLSRNTEH